MTPGRRTLDYPDFDAINAEVARLVEGCSTAGAWSLGQILHHLASVTSRVLAAPVDGPHDTSLRVPPERRDEVLATGRLPEGIPLPAGLGQPEDIDPREGARLLREALAAMAAAPGPLAPHRVFGHLDRDQWLRLVRVHCAHHLSFATPTGPEAAR
ncbi:DUF1569 domain-containing protein [Paludisphaera sp.]|uniref:DUF1569 domain-containing protein n=1 Tax=Paludisphaera sp. TaxID=2017432 RepID=UPI00301C118B